MQPTSDFNTKWYIDWTVSGLVNGTPLQGQCVKNCVGLAPCGGIGDTWFTFHDSMEDCCNFHLNWFVQQSGSYDGCSAMPAATAPPTTAPPTNQVSCL